MPMSKQIIFETTFTHYIGTDIIGEGGAGRVYRVKDDADNIYAIKLLDSSKARGEKLRFSPLAFSSEDLLGREILAKRL